MLVLVVGLVDRISKWIMLAHQPRAFSFDGYAGVELYVNSQYPLFFGPNASTFIGMMAVMFAVFAFFVFRERTPARYPFYALIGVGALSNFSDRLIFGGVIDWLHLGWGLVFNIADLAIAVGCFGLIRSFFTHKTI